MNAADDAKLKYFASIGLLGPLEDAEQDYWEGVRDGKFILTPAAAAAGNSFFSATGGLWSGLVADGVPAPWAVAINAPLTNSLVPSTGAYPLFARDADYTTALPMVLDDQGILRDTLLGEAMFYGARREFNLCRYTERLDFNGTNGWSAVNGCTVVSAWDDNKPNASGLGVAGGTVWKITADVQTSSVLRAASTGYVLEAVPHTFAVWLRADSNITAEIRLYIPAGATLVTKTVSVTTSWQLFYITGTPDGTSGYVYAISPSTFASAAGGVIYACSPRLHQCLGITTAPPDYIPRDATPRTRYWEGAAVDGVAYFAAINANTLNAGTGVVTPVQGPSLAKVNSVADVSTWAPTGVSGIVSTGGWWKITEDTSTGAHHAAASAPNSGLYDKRRIVFSVEVKRAGASDRQWARIFIQDVDGSTGRSAYFDLQNGVFGTVSSGITPLVQALDDGYRVTISMQLGTGASNAQARIYSVTADNTPTHTGDPTKGVLVRNAKTTTRTCRGVDLFPTFTQFLDTRFANWTLTGLGANTTVAGPDGRPASAIKINEDTSTGAHHISLSLPGSSAYGAKWVVASVYVKQASSTDRAWVRLFIQDIDGATGKSVYFNITTGQIGTVTSGLLADVEPIGDGWFRCFFAMALGTGASNAVCRIYSVTADNTPTHTGDITKGLLLFMPNATSAITSASTSDRAIAEPPTPNASASALTVAGSHVSWSVSGVLGRSDFAVAAAYTPYYTPSRQFKGGANSAYSAVTYIRCEAPPNSISAFDDYDTCRTGLTLRPNTQGTTHYAKRAFDLYCGNPNSLFFWKPLTRYEVGQIALRLDTQPNNANARKLFVCVVAGISGASEPTWNNTFTTPPDTTSNLTTDGTVRWQVNDDNGISGNWEPYLGAQLLAPDDTFMAELRDTWFVTGSTYGCWTNGVEYPKQTAKNLANGMPTTLPYRPKYLWLGQFGSNLGVPGAKVPGTADAALMASWRSFMRDIIVWHTAPDAATLLATTT